MSTGNHRQIYKQSFGSIPVDSDGRTYDIHHIDGNHDNNDIRNLQCVSIKEHYDIHYLQEDWGACAAIALRMKILPDILSTLIKDQNLVRIKDGTHHFLRKGKDHHRCDGTVHSFEHIKSGKIINVTCNELRNITGNKHVYKLVKLTNRVQTVKGWKLVGGHPKREIIYKFQNLLTEEIFEGTAYEFRTRYFLNQGNISSMIKNKNRSVKGWKILNTESHNGDNFSKLISA